MATAAIDIAVSYNAAAQVITNQPATVALSAASFWDAAKFTHDNAAFSTAIDAATDWIEIQATLSWKIYTMGGARLHAVRAWIEVSADGGSTWTLIAALDSASVGVRGDRDREEIGHITFSPLLLAAAQDDEYRIRVQRVMGSTNIAIGAGKAYLTIKDVVAEHYPP